jgi:RNA polymerase sigma factor (sigma-70 family)
MNEKRQPPTDDVLVEEAKLGRIEAYAELARRVQEKIYHTIFGMTRNHEDANDLTQETFMYAYRALRTFKQKSSFYTWVYRIAINLTLNFLKKKGREKGREDFEDNAHIFDKAEYAALSDGLQFGRFPGDIARPGGRAPRLLREHGLLENAQGPEDAPGQAPALSGRGTS